MERLTKRENGHAHYPRCFEEPCGGMGCRTEDCEFKDGICYACRGQTWIPGAPHRKEG